LAGLTLDTGALIAAEKANRRFWNVVRNATDQDEVITIPAVVLAQVWRAGRQEHLAQLLASSEVEPFDEPAAKRAGELCGRASVSDIVDAGVVMSAARRGDAILTADPDDLRHLASYVRGVAIIAL
jgi:predicted nucleic acid-binding protein